MIEYLCNGDVAIFNGMKFRRDKNTGYYLNSGISLRLHRAVWESENGRIPDGYHIHHSDGNKLNNDPANLVLMRGSDHSSHHGRIYAEKNHGKMLKNLLENAIPKANEWHRSEEGRCWHSVHAKEAAAKMALREYKCLQCGAAFHKKPLGASKFCSNACKSAYRRDSHVDDEIRRCGFCGKAFSTNRYAKTVTCSRACANRMRKGFADYALRNGGCVQHGG